MGGIESRLRNLSKKHRGLSRTENEGSTVQSTKTPHSQVDEAISKGPDRTPRGFPVSAPDTGNGTPNQRGIDTTQTTTSARSRT